MQRVLRIESVTGVDLELRVAGPGGRSYAFVIDWHIRVVTALAWYLSSLFVYASVGAALADLSISVLHVAVLPAAAIYVLYHPVLEVAMQGRTPGKRIAGVRLVRRDGGIPGAGPLLIRNVFRLLDSLPFAYCVGLVSVMITRDAVRIGDMAAGTVLVYDEPRSKEVLSELSGSAVGRLGLQQAEIVRDLLRRWQELRPDVRASLAHQLLEKLGVAPRGRREQELRSQLEELLG